MLIFNIHVTKKIINFALQLNHDNVIKRQYSFVNILSHLHKRKEKQYNTKQKNKLYIS